MTVAVLGSVNLDVVLRVVRPPKPGETIRALAKAHYLGGKGANQAVASSRAGASTVMLGAVGNDRIGEDLLRSLADYGVVVEDIATLDGIDTGQAHILVSETGENSIAIISGANGAFAYPEMESQAVRGSTVRLAQLEVSVDAIRSFFSSVSNVESSTRILNAAPALLEARDLFTLSDIIVVNETELEAYSEAHLDEHTQHDAIVAAARTLVTREGQRVVVTLGAKGCVLVGADTLFTADGYRAQVVDTTGAGDCFCGVLAATLSNGETLEQALQLANAAGSLAVGKEGAGPSMPTIEEIREKVAGKPK